jgi:hypothetical protein
VATRAVYVRILENEMSRSGYTDDNDDDPLAQGRWRQAVKRSIEGKRGQSLLRELSEALDAMADKHLYPGSFATADGEFCALGSLAVRRGTKVDDLIDDYGDCDAEQVGQRFGIAKAMAAEIMYLNDEYLVDDWKWIKVEICGPMPPHHFQPWGHKTHIREVRVHDDSSPEKRWIAMRRWVQEHISD